MKPAGQTLVLVGLGNLLFEILCGALSNYGWSVLGSHAQVSEPGGIDLLLVWCTKPMAEAIEDVRRVGSEYPTAKIVVAGNEINDTELLQFIEAGVSAYVSSDQGIEELVQAMKMVREGRSPFSGRTTRQILENINRLTQPRHGYLHPRLSHREKQILCLISSGLSNKQIANSLSIAPNTVKNHVHNLLEKLNVKTRHEAARAEDRSRIQPDRQVVRTRLPR